MVILRSLKHLGLRYCQVTNQHFYSWKQNHTRKISYKVFSSFFFCLRLKEMRKSFRYVFYLPQNLYESQKRFRRVSPSHLSEGPTIRNSNLSHFPQLGAFQWSRNLMSNGVNSLVELFIHILCDHHAQTDDL